ncbi:uncharacterized protein LOC127261695 [Andrographis paniculata]|uniref:uncharacterized protein LOC127261695 n=1 Tax=Andrographis paniculata TaxID=175694 RepID=UPI0021E6ECA3|nr:uncharacterized protein LOC127261695 [Andrographis paniculata]
MDALADAPPQVPLAECARLLAPPTRMEVHAVVFSIDQDSVAGPDGFSAAFYQKCWDIIRDDVFDAVLDFFSGAPLLKFYTATTLVLIPKTEGPVAWTDYRLISLCNVSCKIITKLLTARLGPLLLQLLSPHQSGFVRGRAIADNILLASEMVHDLNLRGDSHNLLLKLDLNKAYDRVSWRFLRHALTRFGFPAHFITLIMNCVEHAWYSMFVNGDLGGFFPSSRGLRQGDPLSPTLFVLAADLLSRGLERLYNRYPDLYYRCRGRFRLTHLAYADDVLIFANTSGDRISLLTDFLLTYARTTGQKVNCQKSQLVFSRRCPEGIQRQLQAVTGFGTAGLPLMYLGAPLYVGNRRNILYEELLGKLHRYLQRWDCSVLSHGGRLQLIRSTLFSLPLYLLQVLHPPQAVLHSVEQLFARFFWGSYHGHRRRHWISWADAARPQEEGGLGVRRLSDMARAFSFKLWWRLRDGSSLWARALQHKYFRNSFPGFAPCRAYDSPVWKRLCQIRDEAQNQITWNLGRGECYFWYDTWCGDRPLYTYRQDRPPPIRVREMWMDGSWDLVRLQAYLPENLVKQVSAIPFDPLHADQPIWKASDTGTFTTTSAWEMSRTVGARSWLSSSLWSPLLTPTMSVFLWNLFHRRIPVDEALWRLGLPIVSRCQCCRESETFEHLFFSSAVAQRVWRHFADLFCIHLPRTHAPHLMVSAWRLSSPHTRSIRTYIPLLALWFYGVLAFFSVSTGLGMCILLLVSAFASRLRFFGRRFWCAGKLPPQAIRSGVDLAVTRGLLPLWIETDSASSISLISSSTGHWTLQPCLHHLRLQLRNIEWRISHIYREGNKVADNLANTSVALPHTYLLNVEVADTTGSVKCIAYEKTVAILLDCQLELLQARTEKQKTS